MNLLAIHYFILMSCILVSSFPPSQQNFVQLKNVLEQYIQEDLVRIPKLVRLSFHDLANYDPLKGLGGPHGCLASQPVLGFVQNKGLHLTVSDLQTLLSREFSNVDFSLGDVFSFAGKVAVELAYPCVQIKWRYGRSACFNKNEEPGFPSGFTDSFMNTSSISTSLKISLDRPGDTSWWERADPAPDLQSAA